MNETAVVFGNMCYWVAANILKVKEAILSRILKEGGRESNLWVLSRIICFLNLINVK